MIISPSTLTFLNAVLIYGLAVLSFYIIRIRDRYQDHALGLGALCGLSTAAVSSFYESSFDPFKDFVPISITVALVISLVGHVALTQHETAVKKA